MSIARKLSTVAAGAAALLFTAVSFASGFDAPNSVPEPSTWALVGLAAAIGAAVVRRRK